MTGIILLSIFLGILMAMGLHIIYMLKAIEKQLDDCIIEPDGIKKEVRADKRGFIPAHRRRSGQAAFYRPERKDCVERDYKWRRRRKT